MKVVAPMAVASAFLLSLWLMAVTFAPSAFANSSASNLPKRCC